MQFLPAIRAEHAAASDESMQGFGQRPDAAGLGSPIFNPLDALAATGPLGSGCTVEILSGRRPLASVLRFVELVSRLSHVTLPVDIVRRLQQTRCPERLHCNGRCCPQTRGSGDLVRWDHVLFTNQASGFSRCE